MSDLAGKGVATVGGRDIVVSELTPAQMRQVILANPWPGDGADEAAMARYQVDVWLFEECRLTDLAIFTGLSLTELEAIPPSGLRKILEKAKELNPDFFSALERMGKAQGKH